MTGSQTIIHRSRFVDFTPGNITSIAFSHRSNLEKLTPSDLRVAIGRSNGDIEIWNPRNNWFQEVTIPGGKGRSVEGLCWCNISGEPLRLFSIGGSTVITEWNLATGEVLKNYDCNAGVIWSLAINDNMDKLAVGCDNGTVVIIDISGGPGALEHDTILVRQESRILTLTWNKNDYVIGGCSDGRIRVWNCIPNSESRGRLLHTMKVDKAKNESTLVWSILYLPATNQIVSGDSTGSVKFWDFQYATLSSSFKPHNADVLCLATDVTNTHVFTAGVDRKIFQFTRNISNNQKGNDNKKWVNSSNRLLHGNDVRALAGYQSKGADFLVSGGVEKTIVVSSMSSYAEGNYRKMPLIEPFTKNVLINKEQRLVIMWHETTIKIWVIGDDLDFDKNYKLVCKLVLKDDQNISNCALSPDGQVLVVSRNYTTKLFHLQPEDGKLKVTKLDNDLLLKTGTRVAKFIDNSKIIFCTADDELVSLDLESDNDEKFEYIETSDVQSTKSGIKVPYINNIHQLDVTNKFVVISRGCGIVDLINLETNETKCLVRLTNFITAMKINERKNTVIVVTADNKIYEFNLIQNAEETNAEEESSSSSSSSLLTEWSKHNTENLPKQFTNAKEKCQGVVFSNINENIAWFWGANWVSRFDTSVDLSVNNKRKQKKRTRDNLTITDESNFMSYEDEDDEDIDLDLDETMDALDTSNNRLKSLGNNKGAMDRKVFFFTDKYRPILYFDFISDNELVVVERPPSMIDGQRKAFHLPKIVF
ncbi:similar to Saccharomyces cerevisiae YDR324C UTP4 Subunit of U3-containing 90S preribosome and Small Subunit (SSU) processome complexes [Maudiozyma barnettii]|uniref:Similar to Saccharomyces cerevisiae YDR324C UTP4 Subunit of U3-containing 90S preribosome and Small Subunit (SSU) processome complexes n=1 Tax=Maudiozyma barnettii TaxID=61262 RepID=A0A8H2VDZ2_9SACH|nr:Utp4p [Kazachstania barnettii]CAB4253797.1 similar to Saccharomyces cerevisiae YDR324C UTP4 Subunit of U3-containing 90S preribosome and Small Subunit (SSU) processome complexes [Kazachstania barnettii]CAD1781546.1 similar to Saccharomyces cerevisiae YDR324C UTP4 Subunit of U3-containing 90S preribosome and Small Subunit (SSU) processome complexes [Kazachstania barnettii]